MAKKRNRRVAAASKAGAQDAVADAAGRGKKPKGVAAVGFLKSQGTRAFRKGRVGS
jgi:hypothetical protein